MKKLTLSFIILFLSCSAFSQTKPDTLIIETPKKQKIILISDDVNNFRNINSDSLINAALRKIRDSLRMPGPSAVDFRAMTKEERAVYIKRRNDSLYAIDGLTPKERYKKSSAIAHADKSRYSRDLKNPSPLGLKFNVGGGLIRNKFSPVFEGGVVLAPQKQDYYFVGGYPSYSFLALTANRYYTFAQTAGSTFKTFNDTFITGSIGNRNNVKLASNFLVSEFEMGLGYLIEREGTYFEKNTFKIFGSVVTRSKFIRLTPEIYLTDNFREVFPGFSIKFF